MPILARLLQPLFFSGTRLGSRLEWPRTATGEQDRIRHRTGSGGTRRSKPLLNQQNRLGRNSARIASPTQHSRRAVRKSRASRGERPNLTLGEFAKLYLGRGDSSGGGRILCRDDFISATGWWHRWWPIAGAHYPQDSSLVTR